MFVFKDYGYDAATKTAWFLYGYGDEQVFRESMQFETTDDAYDGAVLERALFLTFLLVGTSYYKCFAGRDVSFEKGQIDPWQASFLSRVYQEGMSQFAFENNLSRENLAQFIPTTHEAGAALPYGGRGIMALQSGGKDSLLVAQLLEKHGLSYAPWYISNGPSHPAVLDHLSAPVLLAHRNIDHESLSNAVADGAMNGHVPVTYIVLGYALIQAVLCNKKTVLAAIAHEGDEPHDWIDDLPVNHQWSKTWQAEQLFAEYIQRYVSPDLQVGSPLRSFSELKVAQVFSEEAWDKFGGSFSSCNTANYQQGADNTRLTWCGHCPKCANSYLLFAPFIGKDELDQTIGKDLFTNPELIDTFKGLLGIDGVMKPFECIGEIDELRAAYHGAIKSGYSELPFDVPVSAFDKDVPYESQAWATAMIRQS